MEDYKKLLTDLYTAHDPERLKQIDYFLTRYKGKEKQFYISQKAKYKNKKPVSDSKKIIEEALARIKSQSDSKATQMIKPKTTLPIQKAESPKTESEQETILTKSTEIKADNKKEIEAINEEKKKSKTIQKPINDKSKVKLEEAKKTTEASRPTAAKTNPKKEDIKPQSFANPIESEKENRDSDANSKVWFKEDKKNEAPQKQVIPPLETRKTSNKRYFFYIFGIVVLFIILALLLFFLFFTKPNTTKKASPKPKTTITKKTAKTKLTTTKPKAQKKQNTKKVTQSKVQKKITSKAIGIRIRKGDIDLPAYFVACYAVRNESYALKKIAGLKAKGFNACYYWIQDFDTYGNPYFKVVIGPFNNRLDAMKKLTPVQERAEFDAYVLELK